MGTFWNTLREQFGRIFNRMTPFQRSMVITVTIVSVVTLAAVMMWASKSDYSILYSGLAGKDAGRIVEKLRELKVDFQLENDGTTIMVPTRKVHELRIEFASLGLPHSGEIGYEVFDKTNIGMTAFVQKLNYHRALEGELSRSIAQLDEVESARVHIVIPEPALFEEDKKEATASVIVRISPHALLSKRQVQGIAYLVAYSVEGLSSRNVNIVDTNGNILTDYMDNSGSIQVTARQLELQRNVEKYLSEKAQSLLDGVLGNGKSQVRIAVAMNFDQVERTKEIYDPERTAVRSEERSEVASTAGQDGKPAGETSEENNVVNYEIDKTIEHLIESVGDVKRISASVLVDGTYKTVTKDDGTEETQFQERPDAELAAIGDMVKNAIGFDVSRQDQISVLCYPFEKSQLEEEATAMAASEKRDFWMAVVEKVFLGLVVIALLLFLRSIVKKGQKIARQMLPSPPQKPQAMLGPERIAPLAQLEQSDNAIPELEEEGLTSDAMKRSQIQRRVKKYVKENPKEASQLIRTWIAEDTYGAKD